MGTYKIGELPRHNTLGFILLLGEIPQKNTYKIKREVVNEVPKFSITSLDFVLFHSD